SLLVQSIGKNPVAGESLCLLPFCGCLGNRLNVSNSQSRSLATTKSSCMFTLHPSSLWTSSWLGSRTTRARAKCPLSAVRMESGILATDNECFSADIGHLRGDGATDCC